MRLCSYAEGRWVEGKGPGVVLTHAVDGSPVAEISSAGIDFGAMVRWGRRKGASTARGSTTRAVPIQGSGGMAAKRSRWASPIPSNGPWRSSPMERMYSSEAGNTAR